MPGPSGKPLFHVAPNFGVVPDRVEYRGQEPNGYFEDNDAVWHHLLRNPPVGRKEGSCLRGALFGPQAQAATQLNVEYLDGLVLDADEFPDGSAYSYDDIVKRLFGHRLIVWTTYNSTPQRPRYRIVLPLACSVPRKQFRALWEFVNNDLGKVIGQKQFNADRLGYLPRLNSEGHRPFYGYAINQGPLFDPYKRYGELPETPDKVVIDNFSDDILLDRDDWVPDEEAVAKARSYMRQAHVGVQPGARHHKLFEKSCQLWWDFYLNEEQVKTILLEINARLSEPKQPVDVLKEVEAGFSQTRGPYAKKQAGQAGARRSRPPPVTLVQIKETAKKLRRKQHDLATALAAVGSKEACAHSGPELNSIVRALARLLGELYPDAEARQLASLLLESQEGIFHAHSASPPSIEQLTQVVFARQDEAKSNQKRHQDREEHDLSSVIQHITGGRRSQPYSLDEFSEYARRLGETHETLKRRLIVQFGPSYFFFSEGGYTPGHEHSVDVLAQQYLSLAKPFGIELHKVQKTEGTRPKTMSELMSDYGSIAEKAIHSFLAKNSHYSPSEKAFVFAEARPRNLEPFDCAEIADYLKIIGSDDLLDWLAHSMNLEKPARLLYLCGPRDCGKSFIPKCLSRLWTKTGPTDGATPFADFNEGLTRCPLVFMDETLPEALRGAQGTENLRREVSDTTRTLRGKFKKNGELVGALRFIFAANEPGHITTSATLTKDDADAILDRILTVHVPAAAGQYLNKLGYERVARWLDDDLFARHVLYLRETRSLTAVDRFGPVPRVQDAAVHSALRFSGATDELLDFIYRTIAQSAPTQESIQVGDGVAGRAILASRDDVVNAWPFVDGSGGAKIPNRKSLTKAFTAVSLGTVRAANAGRDRACDIVDLGLIYKWIDHHRLDRVLFDRKLLEKANAGTVRYALVEKAA